MFHSYKSIIKPFSIANIISSTLLLKVRKFYQIHLQTKKANLNYMTAPETTWFIPERVNVCAYIANVESFHALHIG